MEYALIVHEAQEGGFWAEVPALEGCFGQGETLAELYDDMRGAIRSHLEAQQAFGADTSQPEHILVTTLSLSDSPAA
ncbi:MAG TPA: type II toxin-antitoxin system HicB family antitoxin [Tepidiformaceae bacterium]|nr:type II toxin-antitoxin system HicB family antitoxin [Tepidiformaceae bacterium]